MKVYNRSLDYVTLAMVQGRKGNVEQAAKLFAKAISEPDAVRAVAILETSNKQAFTAAAAVTAASKRLKANEEFDVGDEDMDGLVGDEPMEAATDEDDEEDEGDDEKFDAEFASVLASMSKSKAKPAKK